MCVTVRAALALRVFRRTQTNVCCSSVWPGVRVDAALLINGWLDLPGGRRLVILFVLYTGIPWEELTRELGFGSGMTCWCRLRDWQGCGAWYRLHLVLLAELCSAGQLKLSRAGLDGASVPSPGAAHTGPNPPTGVNSAASAISSWTARASR